MTFMWVQNALRVHFGPTIGFTIGWNSGRKKGVIMNTWIILTIVLVWLVLPAFLIIAACMNSSRLSRAEEALQVDAARRCVRADTMATSRQRTWEMPRESEPVRVPVRYGEG